MENNFGNILNTQYGVRAGMLFINKTLYLIKN